MCETGPSRAEGTPGSEPRLFRLKALHMPHPGFCAEVEVPGSTEGLPRENGTWAAAGTHRVCRRGPEGP